MEWERAKDGEEEEWGRIGVKPPFKTMLAEQLRGLTPTDSVDQIPMVDQIGQHFEKKKKNRRKIK